MNETLTKEAEDRGGSKLDSLVLAILVIKQYHSCVFIRSDIIVLFVIVPGTSGHFGNRPVVNGRGPNRRDSSGSRSRRSARCANGAGMQFRSVAAV